MFFSALTFIDKLADRVTGPMNFRFIMQPLAAILLGIRDGKLDAKAGTPPFILDLFLTPHHRERHIKSALATLLRPIIISIILDAIAQYMIFKHINLAGAVAVGIFVMGVPYSLSRGITNRIVSRNNLNKKTEDLQEINDSTGEEKTGESKVD